MKFPILSLLPLLLFPVSGMTEAEFDTLYKRLDKDADACYRLYEAYRDGDGVEKDATKARKWLLGALALGKPVDDEVARQPWRKKAKLPLGIKPVPNTRKRKNTPVRRKSAICFTPRATTSP